MPLSLKPLQLVAYWVPGSIGLLILYIIDQQNGHLYSDKLAIHWDSAIAVLAIALAGFAVGLFLDAIRDLSEWLWDLNKNWRIHWEFLMQISDSALQRLEDYYFTYYIVSANLGLALTLGELVNICMAHRISHCALILPALLFLVNALTLRIEIMRHSKKLPHAETP